MLGSKSSFLLSLFMIFTFASLPIAMADDQLCEDGTTCQNGSTCVPFEDGYRAPNEKASNGKRSYRCDCSKITGSLHYAGYECEYVAGDYCLFGVNAVDASLSFCTVNGDCKQTYQPNGDEIPTHLGCACEGGFEGEYCEYIKGEAPIKKGVGGGIIAALIIGFTVISVLGGFIIIRRKIVAKKAKTVESGSGSMVENEDAKVHTDGVELT